MTNTFDITYYGAVGDGVTDCTAAIQMALDAAGEVRGCVIVPPGNYLTGYLHMRAHTRLEGKSAWSFRSDGLSLLTLKEDAEGPCLLDITGAFGCTVAGISMDGRRIGENVHGIYVDWDKYNGGSEEDTPCIDDCRIGNFTGDGVHLRHIWCFSVRHSMLHRNGGAGLYIDGWDAFLIDNWFTANAKGGLLGGPCAASITATGNRVEWNRGGGFLMPAGNMVNLTGNYFDRSFGPALKLGNGDNGHFENASVTGNVFYRSGCPDKAPDFGELDDTHVLLDNASNITLTGNTFRVGENDGGGGTRSPNYAVTVRKTDCAVVSANAMKGGALVRTFRIVDDSDASLSQNVGILE